MDVSSRFNERTARHLAVGVAVFVFAFVVGAFAPRVVAVPLFEPFIAAAALVLLIAATLARSSLWVQTAFRRTVWVLFGALAGWWVLSFWLFSVPLLVVIVPLVWFAIAAGESSRSPSLPWSVVIASAPTMGWPLWWLSMMESLGELRTAVAALASEPAFVGFLLGALFGPPIVVSLSAGVFAYLGGRHVYRNDGLRFALQRPTARTAVLLGVAVASTLFAAGTVWLL